MDTSISGWGWFKRPGAHFENGLLVEGNKEPSWYFPESYQAKILHSLINISDETTAEEFARSWGLLGLNIENKREFRNNSFSYLLKLNEPKPNPDINRFIDEKVKQCLVSRNHKQLINYLELGKEAAYAVPTQDHYLPMIYAIGLQSKEDTLKFIHEGFQNRSVSMRAFQIG